MSLFGKTSRLVENWVLYPTLAFAAAASGVAAVTNAFPETVSTPLKDYFTRNGIDGSRIPTSKTDSIYVYNLNNPLWPMHAAGTAAGITYDIASNRKAVIRRLLAGPAAALAFQDHLLESYKTYFHRVFHGHSSSEAFALAKMSGNECFINVENREDFDIREFLSEISGVPKNYLHSRISNTSQPGNAIYMAVVLHEAGHCKYRDKVGVKAGQVDDIANADESLRDALTYYGEISADLYAVSSANFALQNKGATKEFEQARLLKYIQDPDLTHATGPALYANRQGKEWPSIHDVVNLKAGYASFLSAFFDDKIEAAVKPYWGAPIHIQIYRIAKDHIVPALRGETEMPEEAKRILEKYPQVPGLIFDYVQAVEGLVAPEFLDPKWRPNQSGPKLHKLKPAV